MYGIGKDPSDEETTNNQGYFTQLATHVLKINNSNQRNVILVDLNQFTKSSGTNKHYPKIYMYRRHGKFEDCILHGIYGRHLEKDFHNFGFESHDHL